MKNSIFILVFILFSTYSFSQANDSLVYKQHKSVMFSNEYIFYKDGRFKHYFRTDDGQIWYGVGEYKDKWNKRILYFNDIDTSFKIKYLRIHYEANFQRKLIKFGKKFISKDYYHTTRKPLVKLVIKSS